MKKLLLVLPFIAGCATSTPIHYTDGQPAQRIECGAATPSSVCYNKANDVCPAGYYVLAESGGFNRQSLTVRCK